MRYSMMALTASVCFCSLTVSAQSSVHTYLNLDWVLDSGYPDTIQWSDSKADLQGNTYFIGNTFTGTTEVDILVKKIDPQGNVLWEVEYDYEGGADYGTAICIQDSFVYVAGAGLDSATNSFNAVLAQFSDVGVQQWVKDYDGTGLNNVPTDLAANSVGDVFVSIARETVADAFDYCVLGVSSEGTLDWIRVYDGGFADIPGLVTVSSSDVVVSGASQSSSVAWDYTSVQYSHLGVPLDTVRISAPGAHIDRPTSITRDNTDNIYITGVSLSGNEDMKTAKINYDMTLSWVKTLDSGGHEGGADVAVDASGNVYVVGYSEDSYGVKRPALVKYNSAGVQLFVKRYAVNAPYVKGELTGLAIINDTSIFLTGFLEHSVGRDLITIEVDGIGNIKWTKVYTSVAGGICYPTAIHIDGNKITVVGREDFETNSRYLFIRYTKRNLTNSLTSDSIYGDYAAGQVIVDFCPDSLDGGFVSSVQRTFARIEDLVPPLLYDTLAKVLGWSVQTSPYAYKIHTNFTPLDTISIARNGDTVRIPPIWATFLVEYNSGLPIESVLDTLQGLPGIYNVSPNYIIYDLSSPNDVDYSAQESLQGASLSNGDINIEDAWDFGVVGDENLLVGIHDFGIYFLHEDFSKTSGATKVVDGFNYIDNRGALESLPSASHGTQVTGIIGAIRNNGLGIAGIAGGDDDAGSSGVNFIDLQILEEGVSTLAQALPSLYDASRSSSTSGIRAYGVDLSNHSWGTRADIRVTAGLAFAGKNSVVSIAGRGNAGNSCSISDRVGGPVSPGGDPDRYVVSVGFIEVSGEVSDGSCIGRNIDFVAPGSSSSVWTTTNGTTSSAYGSFSGSSASTPHATGVAALLLEYHAPYIRLLQDDIEYIFEESAEDIVSAGYDSPSGHGRLLADQALSLLNLENYRVQHVSFSYDLSDLIKISDNVVRKWNGVDVVVDIYKLNATVSHSIPGTAVIVDSYPLHSISTTSSNDGVNADAVSGYVQVSNVTATSAEVLGYHYFLESFTSGTPLGFWADQVSPNATYSRVGYSLILEDANFSSLDLGQFGQNCSVYPNPVHSGRFSVEEISAHDSYVLYNNAGVKMQSGMIGTDESLDISALPSGVYLLELHTVEGYREVCTLIKQP